MESIDKASEQTSSEQPWAFRTYRPGTPQWNAYHDRIIGSTYEHTQALRKKYLEDRPLEMTIAEAMAFYDDIVDESDPDLVDEPQIKHAVLSAMGAKSSGLPEWAIALGFIHDVGKVLVKRGLAQPFVVGDEWPVGCAPSEKIVCSHFFAQNPDTTHPVYGTKLGIYEEGCGLDNLVISFGHDEYLHRVLDDAIAEGACSLPPEALHIVRYHSAYVIHTSGEYDYFLTDRDRRWMSVLHAFRDHIDLYTKREAPGRIEDHLPGIYEIVHRYIRPDAKLRW